MEKNCGEMNRVREDFGLILNNLGIRYKTMGNHLIIGSEPPANCDVVYISCVLTHIQMVLEAIMRDLIDEGLSCTIVKDIWTAEDYLTGVFGEDEIGKVITIYIPNDRSALLLIQRLIRITRGFKGPQIPGKVLLGELVYTDPGLKTDQGKRRNNLQVFQNNYMVLSIVKTDVKGNVYQCFYLKGIFNMGFCIIKEGKKFMWSDHAGRDIRDRLEWQKKIHEDLADSINIPRIYDLFEENGSSYLVMECIRGKSLGYVINQVYKGKCWGQLALADKRKLLNLLLTIIEIIERIHKKGYVHRDLSSANFLITRQRSIYAIDLELAYGLNLQYPAPPFQLGTPGYMSPEQIARTQPTFKEDIYALGALMIVFFTNSEPVKFELHERHQIIRSIFSFTGEQIISQLISKCLAETAGARPELSEIKDVLKSLLENIRNNKV